MKKIFIVLFSLSLVFAASFVSAEGLYVSGKIGATATTDSDLTFSNGVSITGEGEYDTGLLVGGALGYALGNGGRVEGEVSYLTSDIDSMSVMGIGFDVDGEINIWSFLLNGYFDIETDTPFTPFLGAGIGVANVTFEGDGDDADDTVFAYQAGAGVGFAVTDTVNLDLGYRYMGTTDIQYHESGVDVEVEYGSHNFYGGIRVALP